MWGTLLQHIRALFRMESHELINEPVTHRLDSHPILPQGMMEAIAPAYEEMLAKQKAKEEEKAPSESRG